MAEPAAATTERIRAADGVSLAVHRLGDPDGQPVVMAPGTFSNWSFWLGTRGTGFARALAAAGYDVHVLDFRGHGASQRPAPGGRRWTFDMWGRLDMAAAIRHAAQGGKRPLLVGHSAGGASILAALAGEPSLQPLVHGAIIVATPLPWLQLWRRVAAHAMRFGSRWVTRFPAKLLGLGPEDELPGVMEQWMDWNLRGHWIGDDGTDYGVALTRLTVPTLFLVGAGDHRFAPPAAVRGLFELTGGQDRTFVLAGTGTGFARDYDHVGIVVSREARDEVWPLMLAWLGERGA